MNYQETGDAFYRWSTPTVKFQAPKPFSLSSISGDIHILGGEKAEIKILVNGEKPDTVSLQLTPSQTSTQKRDSLALTFLTVLDTMGYNRFELPELFQDFLEFFIFHWFYKGFRQSRTPCACYL